MFNTPILFILFNRPDTTEQVFKRIREVRPRKLFIAGDGPRDHKAGEYELCQQAREIVLKNIDWDCEVKTLLREKNLGCKIAVSSALNWFFSEVEMGIILEDDCLPDISFFHFCEEMLLKYQSDSRVMHISGTNFIFKDQPPISSSYYFSKYISIWGWASWARAWNLYDPDLKKWPEFKKENLLQNILHDPVEEKYFTHIFDLLHENKFDTWDLQLFFANFFNHAASVSPAYNLVSNIGFRADATHTHNDSILANVPARSLAKITDPEGMVIRHDFDTMNFDISFGGRDIRKSKLLSSKLKHLMVRIKYKLLSYLPGR